MVTRQPDHAKRHNVRGRARRAALIDAAIEIVAHEGVTAVTHRAVAARAGFPPSTTSYFFPVIDDLLVEALAERMVRQVERFKQLAATLDGATQSLDEMVDVVVATLVASPVTEVLAQFDLYVSAARRDELRPYATAMIDAFQDLATVAFESSGVAGAAERARALVAMVDGLWLQRIARGQPADEFECDLRIALTTIAGGVEPPQNESDGQAHDLALVNG